MYIAKRLSKVITGGEAEILAPGNDYAEVEESQKEMIVQIWNEITENLKSQIAKKKYELCNYIYDEDTQRVLNVMLCNAATKKARKLPCQNCVGSSIVLFGRSKLPLCHQQKMSWTQGLFNALEYAANTGNNKVWNNAATEAERIVDFLKNNLIENNK